ncbi:UNKNOWN [Stylonychia lemnae]|uniref:Uncharacterized protein n=1 Tax=Stylonychia lemnae TaxID=5949 RepID=A0A077ZVD8_STYLE|nr:UNKNOWN [Stylonychia lemnae]|eukprot:CDW72386.1 UNKNOWN [Stylonychia lemnae]
MHSLQQKCLSFSDCLNFSSHSSSFDDLSNDDIYNNNHSDNLNQQFNAMRIAEQRDNMGLLNAENGMMQHSKFKNQKNIGNIQFQEIPTQSRQDSYLQKLKEELEVEEELRSIFGFKRQATLNTDVQLDSSNQDEFQKYENLDGCISSDEKTHLGPLRNQSYNEFLNHQFSNGFFQELFYNHPNYYHNTNTNLNRFNSGEQQTQKNVQQNGHNLQTLKQPKPLRTSLGISQSHRYQSLKDSLIRPSNPIIKDLAFKRANSDTFSANDNYSYNADFNDQGWNNIYEANSQFMNNWGMDSISQSDISNVRQPQQNQQSNQQTSLYIVSSQNDVNQ